MEDQQEAAPNGFVPLVTVVGFHHARYGRVYGLLDGARSEKIKLTIWQRPRGRELVWR